MIFSSALFIMLFLPIVIIGYFFCLKKRQYRNYFLVAASLIFYAYGEPIAILLLILSIFANWIVGMQIGRREGKLWLVIGVTINVAVLVVFKYLGFIFDNIEYLSGVVINFARPALPIGISFYTFQAISYLIDVYRKRVSVQKSIMNLALYISLFPQLIAGPIVRYETFEREINERNENFNDIYEGIHRFIRGLGKKVILADQLAAVADRAFSLQPQNLSVSMAWLGAICYSLQIFYDFSGYSDMAIGLARIFGFHFMENFEHPYISKSITEFWRRWHISLGTWFRDYVYIPLGGNRNGRMRQVGNMLVVWLLTGLWHGAQWTFVLWGLYYFVLLFIEKTTGISKSVKWYGRIYTIPAFIIGWVLFRADNVSIALQYVKSMFCFTGTIYDSMAGRYFVSFLVVIVVALLFCGEYHRIYKSLEKIKENRMFIVIREAAYLLVFVVCVCLIIQSSYSPFIYFNF